MTMHYIPGLKWIALPTPFPVGPVNVALILSEPVTLIDCGPDTRDAREALKAALKEERLIPADVKRIILSHFHSDHSGLARWFREMSGAEVLAHPGDHHYLVDAPELIQNKWADRIEAFFRRSGVPAVLSEAIIRGFRRLGHGLGGIGSVSAIDPERIFSFDGLTMKVLHAPGHSPGSIVLYSEETRNLVSGDTLLQKITPNPLVELKPDGQRAYSSLGAYLKSITELERLPWVAAFPGHGSFFPRRPLFFKELRNGIKDRARKVAALVSRGNCTAYSIARAIFGDVRGGELFLAVSETASYLDLLIDDGLIACTVEGDIEHYRAAAAVEEM